jgi:hypothetical protein
MTGNVNKTVQGKQNGGDERGEPVTLICAFLQRKDFSSQEHKSDNNKNEGRPTKLGPSPEPIAFRVKRALFAERRCPKSCEDSPKIAEPDSNPRRIAKQLESIRENLPTKISGDIHTAELAKMKSLHRLSAKNQKCCAEKQQERSNDRKFRRRALPK